MGGEGEGMERGKKRTKEAFHPHTHTLCTVLVLALCEGSKLNIPHSKKHLAPFPSEAILDTE